MKTTVKYSFVLVLLASLFFSFTPVVETNDVLAANYSVKNSLPKDTIPFRFKDSNGNPYSPDYKSGLYLRTPSNITSTVEYDPIRKEYVLTQRLGGLNYREPFYMSEKEYQKYSFDQSMQQYWRDKVKNESFQNQSGLIPNFQIPGEAFDKIFGSNVVTIKPQGSAELIFGVNISNVANPALPIRLQREVIFDYDQKIQMGIHGKIGDKLSLGINYNTEAAFDFENETKIGYKGSEDEIIQSIEAGNVSLPLNGSLITGSHTLFGFKTELKFGKLKMTSVFSQQKSEQSVIEVKQGAQVSEFDIKADDYEANKHFFLSQAFKDNYDKALSDLPIINSAIQITRIEVWVTNKSRSYDNARNILAFMDLAEGRSITPDALGNTVYNIWQPDFVSVNSQNIYPHNALNDLYENIITNYSSVREISSVTSALSSLKAQYGFVGGQDWEKIENARLLTASEYTINDKLGFISLNQGLNSDEVLAVAYEYTVQGEVYRVGEFSNGGVDAPKTLILKLIKPTNLTPKLPVWDLMMKNVYSIGAYQVNSDEFVLDVLYSDVKTGNDLNYLPADAISKQTLLTLLNLDNLNRQLSPSPDGRFDFVEPYTITSKNGRVFFPVREPFGSYLKEKINNPEVAQRFVYQELYDSTQSKAKQVAEKNKFYLRGSYRSSQGSEISLNAMNVPRGSVNVTAGGRQLDEGVDYIVDYNLGTVTILNQGLLETGTPIKISLESNSMFAIGTKSLVGTHFDYNFSDDFRIGGTIMHLSERPLITKVSIGDEPISNTIWGLDLSYYHELPQITRFIDRYIPFVETKELSSITIEGEFAHLIPGTSKSLDENGVSYIDDFEGSKTTIDLKTPSAWYLASTPQGQLDMFPEGELNDSLPYGYNRAKLAWYHINSDLVRSNTATPDHLKNDPDQQSNHFVREVYEQDLFPNKESVTSYPTTIPILNLAFYPQERGPYNFDVEGEAGISAGIDALGKLKNPESRWGGMMRRLVTNDFEASNIEYIEFWVMDPFVYNENAKGGDLYFNLGNISEDILKDSRKSFEQGLPLGGAIELVDTTAWGRVSLKQSLVYAFDNDPATRAYQDVGLDGLGDEDERSFHLRFLNKIANTYTQNSDAYKSGFEDPATDNYRFFKGSIFDEEKISILDRYKFYNNVERNSPSDEQNTEDYPTSGTLLPDVEDINQDNTLSENEAYYQYHLRITPQDLEVGKGYVVDMIEDTHKRKNNQTSTVRWYQFKVPIQKPTQTVGAIQDFKSIRFMRMFMRGWEEEAILRFAKLDLVRGEWRRYSNDISEPKEDWSIPQNTTSELYVSAVNIEENGSKTPVNYVLPPEVTRETDPTNPQLRQLNEQSIMLRVNNLEDGDAKAVYKNVMLDVRQYQKLQMWLHAEALPGGNLNDNDLCAFIRLGTDYTENYYEYEIPLNITDEGAYNNEVETDREKVWPLNNKLELDFEVLQMAKQDRNNAMREVGSNVRLTAPFKRIHGKNLIYIMGNPNLAKVKTIMLGIRNRSQATNPIDDDGMSKSGEIWFNELRLTDFDQSGGWASNMRVTTKLADFASVTLSGNISTPGFGSIDKNVNERSKEEYKAYDFTSSVELGKFFPKHYGVRLPLYVGYAEGFINPQYNPLDPDIKLSATINNPNISDAEKEELLNKVQTYTLRKSINVTNAKISPKKKSKTEVSEENGEMDPLMPNNIQGGDNSQKTKPIRFYDISNFSVTYAYNEEQHRDVNTEQDLKIRHYGSINYIFNKRPKNFEPFKNVALLKAKPLTLIREFNFYLAPSQVGIRTDVNKTYQALRMRNLSNPEYIITPSYDKNFIWNRDYDVKWNLTKALKLDFHAGGIASIDESPGSLDKDDPFYDPTIDTVDVWQNIRNFGRTTSYAHRFDVTWKVPIDKLPIFMGWTDLNAKYSATYTWQTSPILKNIEIGNTIKNTSSIQLNGQANLQNIYNKSEYFKRVNRDMKSTSKPKSEMVEVTFETTNVNLKQDKPKIIAHKLKTIADVKVEAFDEDGKVILGDVDIVSDTKITFTPQSDAKSAKIVVKAMKQEKQSIAKTIADATANILTGVKNLSLTYNQTSGSMLPGFLQDTYVLGMNQDFTAPGWDYVLGMQDELFAQRALQAGWLTHNDSLMTSPYVMTNNTTINFRATIEPLHGLRIDATATETMAKNREENYLYLTNKYKFGGNYTASYNIIKTSFWKLGENYQSEAYDNFLAYRPIIAERLAEQRTSIGYDKNQLNRNPDWDPTDPLSPEFIDDGYPNGYGAFHQEVLIPAFLAAYADKDPKKVKLGYFPSLPSLNWRVKYDGLTRLRIVSKFIKTVSVTHAYKSSYSLGSFGSNALYDFDNTDYDGFSYVRDELTDLFIPEYQMNTVALSEQYSPFISLDMSWKNSLMSKIEFSKGRELALSLNNGQVIETTTNEFIIGGGYKIKDLEIVVNKNQFKSDLDMRLDISLRDMQTIMRQMKDNQNQVSAGQTNLSIKFSADYRLNKSFNLRFFYDQVVNNPKVSTSFRTANTKVGISIRFTLIPQ